MLLRETDLEREYEDQGMEGEVEWNLPQIM